MRNLFSPLRYPGGKSKVFNIIVSLFEKNDIIATLWGNDPEKLKDAESYVIDAFKTGKFKNSFD